MFPRIGQTVLLQTAIGFVGEGGWTQVFITTPVKWAMYFIGQAESRRMWISECGNKLKEIRAKIN
jgi:hypothetical protein